MPVPSAVEMIDQLADAGSFQAFEDQLHTTDPLSFVDSKPYPERLASARASSGAAEAVRSGRARIDGVPVVLLLSEYGFIGGSVGVATGELIARTFEYAEAEGLPVVAVTRSGGTRMQEGNFGFAQIPKALIAVDRFRRAGLPYIAYLANPTIGGVLASWGSRAHVTYAEPGALIGFAGPRGTGATIGAQLPDGVQTAENLADHGLIDEVFPPSELRDRLASLLRVLRPRESTEWTQSGELSQPEAPAPGTGAWESVRATQEPDRFGARQLLTEIATDVTPLRGDGRAAGDDPSISTLVCLLGGVPAVVVAQDRSARTGGARPGADGYRKARRAIAVAGELGLSLVTIVDTPGAQLSSASEQSGLASELANCLSDLLSTPAPVLGVLLGQGGGGGALALLSGDTVLAADDAWLAPIAPEAASAILYGDASHAQQMARGQRITAANLIDVGLVDHVLAGPVQLATAVVAQLRVLAGRPTSERSTIRYERYRQVGNSSLYEDAASMEQPTPGYAH